jgi:DMSO/TMAO reductase YedYZ molybdopterin-dependent catalytic subunit
LLQRNGMGLLRKHELTSPRSLRQMSTGIAVMTASRRKAPGGDDMFDRRDLLKGAGLAAMAATLNSTKALALDTVTLPFANGERPLVKYPQKRPMIGLTSRPPQLETPFAVFNDGPITPNNAFFVRYHLADLPYNLDPDKFTLEVKGKVDKPLKLSLKDIRKMKATEIVAVNQCSGNSRGLVEPRVAGGQLANGAMGNARWRGVPLKTVLEMAGVQAGAKQVVFSRHRRRSDAGLWHERRRFAVSQRIPAAPGCARLLRHLLGQAPQRDHRRRHCL